MAVFVDKLNNKYKRWHDQIIERAQRTRTFRIRPKSDAYYEKHHVIPKCFGGSNSRENRVWLTFREHFLIHWLLPKFLTGSDKRKMLMALVRMTGGLHGRGSQTKSWQYALVRKARRDALVGRKLPQHQIDFLRQTNLGRKASPQTKARQSEAGKGNQNLLGHRHSLKSKEAISQSLKSYYENNKGPSSGTKWSEERRQQMRERVRIAYDTGGLREKRKLQKQTRNEQGRFV